MVKEFVEQRPRRVAFLIFGISLGGVTSVSKVMAERFAHWGIETHFICHSIRSDANLSFPKGGAFRLAQILPSSDESLVENKRSVENYVLSENIEVLFSCVVPWSFFNDFSSRISHQCKIINWIHSMPLWEYWDAIWVNQVRSEYSLKCWFQWHILGGRKRLYDKRRYQEVMTKYREELARFDRTIVLCPEYVQELSETLALEPSDRERLISITNTIDITPSVRLEDKKKVIAFVGRLSIPSKRPDHLLRIWKCIASQLPDWTLRLYGTGEDEALLKREVKKKRLPRVEFKGFVSDPEDIYPEVDIVCLLSPFEGFPMVLIEGQNYGCVPMTFDSYGAARSIVGEDGYAGRLIPAFDLDAYAKALLDLCRNDAGRRAMQERCLQKRYDYAPEVNDATWQALFDEYL